MSTTAERRRRKAAQAEERRGNVSGSLAVLNTGAGDINVSFNDQDDAEVDRALGMLLDMQMRGYAIMVRQDDGTYARAVAINRETKSYVVIPPAPEPSAGDADAVQEKPKRGRRRAEQSVSGRKAVGVARSAGGCHVRSPFELLRLARS